MNGWAGGPGRHRRRIAAAMMAIIIICAIGISRLQIDAGVGAFSDGPDSAAAVLAELEQTFPHLSALTIMFSDGSPQTARAIAEAVAAAITRDAEAVALGITVTDDAAVDADRADFVENMLWPHLPWYIADDDLGAFRERLTSSGMVRQIRRTEMLIASPSPGAARMAESLARDPLQLSDFLPSAMIGGDPARDRGDASVATVAIRTTGSAGDTDYAGRVIALLQRHIETQVRGRDVTAQIAGPHAIAAFSATVIQREMTQGAVFAMVLIGVLFLVVYRRVSSCVAAGLPVLAATVGAFGLLGWVFGDIAHLGTIAAAILTGLAVDFGIHSVAAWTESGETLSDPAPVQARISQWYRIITRPLITGGLTSGLAFAVIALVPIGALRDFGFLGAIGMIGAVLGALLLIPAWLAMLKGNRPAATPTGLRSIERGLSMLTNRPGRVMSVAGVAVVLTLAIAIFAAVSWGGPLIDGHVASMHPAPNPPLDASAQLAAMRGTGETMLVRVVADDPAQTIHRAGATAARLRAVPGVESVVSAGALFPVRAAMELPDPESVERDLEAALAASLLAPEMYDGYAASIADMLRTAPPTHLSVMAAMPRDDQALIHTTAAGATSTVLVVTLDRILKDAADRGAMIHQIRAAAASDDHGDGSATLAALPAIAVDWTAAARRWGPRIIWLTIIGVLVVLLVSFRRPMDVFAALVPALTGLVIVGTGMLLIGPGWNAISMVGLPLLIGLGIDDGIFAVAAVQRLRRDNAVAAQLAPTVGAMTMTTITTMIAFGTLTVSSVAAMRHLGWVMISGVICCLLGTVVLSIPLALVTARHRGAIS